MWQAFINLLITILSFIESYVGDWGLAVIILTVLVRLAIQPLQARSFTANAKMQALQPKMQALQEKYKDDPERMQQELRSFYADNKFNPLGGCLPVIIQMPIFFALYRALLHGIPSDATLFGLINLGVTPAGSIAQFGFPVALTYILFDLGFGVLTLIPMLLNQTPGADSNVQNQSKIMGVVMAIMMVFVGWNLVVGVLLYYVISSFWGVIQQKVVTKRVTSKVQSEIAEREAAQGNQPVPVEVVRKERKNRPHKKK